MELGFWTKLLLPLILVVIDITSSTETTTEKIKNYGNRIRRARAQREKANPEKIKREVPQNELQRTQRQANNNNNNINNNNNNGPPADPSYDFAFRTPEYQRRENSDSLGRVRGLYSFIDDVGEKHLVRYAASADRGFEVFNSVPDASRYVQYSAPLYKTSPKARGRIAYERGPGRQYKFISAGPDQRRSESTGPDGVTRGAYSYLDDKGVQRTTQYIAGAGIGYRVVQDTTGPQTHLLPRPAGVEFGILYPRAGGGGINRGVTPGTPVPGSANGNGNGNGNGNDFDGNNGIPGAGNDDDGFGGLNSPGFGSPNSSGFGAPNSPGGIGGSGAGNNGGGIGGFDDNSLDSDLPPFGDRDDFDNTNRPASRPGSDVDFPNRGFGTIIRNTGDTYFAGIAPGNAVRAHVQNIDLRPYSSDGELTPGEALRRDERRSLRLRFRG